MGERTQATCRIEYAPGFSPWTARPSGGDWETLGTPYSYTRGRGRPDLFEKMDAHTCSVELPDCDGALFARGLLPRTETGSVAPYTPIRVVLTVDGVDHTRFTGYVLEPPTPAGTGRARTAIIKATDWIGITSGTELPSSLWASFVAGYEPRLWWRDKATSPSLNPDRSDHIYNEGTEAGGDGYTQADPANTVTSLAPDKLVTDDPSQAWYVGRRISTESSIEWANTITTSFVAYIWVQINTTPSATFDLVWGSSSQFGSANRWRIRITTAGYVTAIAYSSGVQVASATVSVNHCDGDTHLIRLSWDDTVGLKVHTDLGAAIYPAPFSTPNASGYVVTPSETATNGATVIWSNLVIAPFMDDDPAGFLAGTPNVIGSLTVAEHLAFLAARAGVTLPELELNLIESIYYAGLTKVGGTLGSNVLDLASEFLGAAYMTRDGKLRIRDASWLDSEIDFGQYENHLASLTDDPFHPDLTGDPLSYARPVDTFLADQRVAAPPDLPVVRYKPATEAGGSIDDLVNQVRIEDPYGGVLTWRDQASIDQWGEHTKTLTVGFGASAGWARTAARDLVAKRGRLTPKIREITVTPLTDEAAAFVLAADLEDLVHFHAMDPTGSDVLIDTSCRIQSESESWTGSAWSATYTLAEA